MNRAFSDDALFILTNDSDAAKVRRKVGTAKYFADIFPFCALNDAGNIVENRESPAKKWPAKQRNHLVIRRISAGHFFVRGHFQLSVIPGYGV